MYLKKKNNILVCSSSNPIDEKSEMEVALPLLNLNENKQDFFDNDKI